MKIKTAFWTCSLVLPAAIAPLATSTSCSQTWGYKTPISIGTNLKGTVLDPYAKFAASQYESLVDLNGLSIVPQLQSNFAINTSSNTYYGYSLPEKWNSQVQDEAKHPAEEHVSDKITIKWNKGMYDSGSAGWYSSSDSVFEKSNTISGVREDTTEGTTKKTNVSEYILNYKNNTLATNIEMVSMIGTTIYQMLNYALQYQGTQIGTSYESTVGTNTNLATAWGGNITHGEKETDVNRKFMESIFASNAVTGTSKGGVAVLRPTHVEFSFKTFPIVAYAKDASGNITGVNDLTKDMLNYHDAEGKALRPSETGTEAHPEYPAFWSTKSDLMDESIYDIRTGKTTKYKYRVYSYTNVPVIVKFNAFARSYVNPSSNSSFMVSDYYSSDESITNTIGDSWKEKLPAFVGGEAKDAVPTFNAYKYEPVAGTKKVLAPIHEDKTSEEKVYKVDYRLYSNGADCDLQQDDFIVLINYAYKEYEGRVVEEGQPLQACPEMDRVTMTGVSTVFPAYFCEAMQKDGKSFDKTFFTKANNIEKVSSGYIFDSNVVNKYNNLFLELLKRASGQGLVTEATKLNDVSKAMLKFLGYMFGDNTLTVNTANFLKTNPISPK